MSNEKIDKGELDRHIEKIENGSELIKKIDILEANISNFTHSEFEKSERKVVVSSYLHPNFLDNDCKLLFTKEECHQINEMMYNFLCEKIKYYQKELEEV